MSLLQAYADAADTCAAACELLASQVPRPQLVQVSGHLAYRYLEKSQQQAMVLKCVAAVSRLRASFVLVRAGFIQEQAALHRLIDEANEDIWFLALGLMKNEHTPQHAQFLTAFFSEEFEDANDIVRTRNPRNLVPRRKIRAFIARAGGSEDPFRDTQVADAIGSLYSGFVHGAAQHILVSYGGDPPHFALNGLAGTPLIAEHLRDAWNYVFRTLRAHQLAAGALDDRELFERLGRAIAQFQNATGRKD